MSYEARCIFPRRRIKAAIKAVTRTINTYEPIARKAMEEAAHGLLQIHGRHLTGYCQAMGSACFYARYAWYDTKKEKEINRPIATDQGRDENIPITVQRAIEKWERDFLHPYTDTFGWGFEPLRLDATIKKSGSYVFVKVVGARDW